MGVTKKILKNGDGTNFPKSTDTVEMHYNGTLPVGTKLADGTVTTEEKK
jgi:FK506-binding protein 1